MLATLVDEPFSRQGWLFEPKLDGERCVAIRSGAYVQLFSRNEMQLNNKYPELVAAFRRQKSARFVVDGEIVAFKEGVTSFAKLQPRMQVRHPSEELLRSVPVWIHLFDLLHLDGYDTRQLPLRYRKGLLQKAWLKSVSRSGLWKASFGIQDSWDCALTRSQKKLCGSIACGRTHRSP